MNDIIWSSTHTHTISQLLPLTCWALWRDRSPVKGRTVPGDGPNLAGSSDGDGFERLVSSHVEPRRSLRNKRLFEQSPPKYFKLFVVAATLEASLHTYQQTLDLKDILHSLHTPMQERTTWYCSAQLQWQQENGSECLWVTHQMLFNLFIGCLLACS